MMLGALLRLTELLSSSCPITVFPDYLPSRRHPKGANRPRCRAHRQFGIFVAKDQASGKTSAFVWMFCPTLLHLFGLPVGKFRRTAKCCSIYEGNPADIQRIELGCGGERSGMHPPDKQNPHPPTRKPPCNSSWLRVTSPNPMLHDRRRHWRNGARAGLQPAQACMDGGVNKPLTSWSAFARLCGTPVRL